MLLRSLCLATVCSLIPLTSANAFSGKVEAGVISVKMDIINYGQVDKTMVLTGVAANTTVFLWQGLALKGNVMFASGDANLQNAGVGFAFYLPVPGIEGLHVAPATAITFGRIRSERDVPIPQLGVTNFAEAFDSTTPSVGGELTYAFNEQLRVTGSCMYAWSRTRTVIDNGAIVLVDSAAESTGFNWLVQAEYQFRAPWSLSVAVAKNNARTNEAHGVDVFGGRIAIGYSF